MTLLGKKLLFIVILCVLWLVIATVLHVVFFLDTGHSDFFPPWAGARLALFESQDPYAPQTTIQIQRMIYGHTIESTRDQQGFAYPAHVIPLLLPFWLLPMRAAAALWSSSSIVMAVLLIGVVGRVPWRLSWIPASLVLAAHVLLVVFQGQFTLFVAACLGFGYWLYTHSRSALAGLVLVGATIKPELVLLPVTALLAMAIFERRLTFLLAFSIGSLVVAGASISVAGMWVPRWLTQIRAYRGYAMTVWPLRVLWQHWPITVPAGATLLLVASGINRWDRDTVFAALCPLNLLLLPQTLPYSLAVLLVPVALTVLDHRRFWAPVVTVISWGSLFLPYRIQMTMVPVAVLVLVLLAQYEASSPERHQGDMEMTCA